MPEYSALVKAYKDKPIQFLAVAANITAEAARTYQQQTGLAMPIYADSVGLMQQRYGQKISLQNIHQFRVISPTGTIVGYQMTKDALDKIIADYKPEWRFKGEKTDAKLLPALDAFETGHWQAGMKLLAPLRKSPTPAVAEAAEKLFAEVKKEGEPWKDEADKAVETDPIAAYDSYSRVAGTFAADDLGKSVAAPLKTLTANKDVAAELAARKAFATFVSNLGKRQPGQRPLALKACQDLAKKYDGTPTGTRAGELALELAK